jgi:TRAP-type C4-dicarboxylate transport system substrate-binding protein
MNMIAPKGTSGRRRRLTLSLAAVAPLVLAAACGGGSGGSGGSLTVKWAGTLPDTNASSVATEAAIKQIQSGGKIKVKYYGAGSLFTEDQMQSAIANGSVDMGTTSLHRWSSVEPSLNIDELPYLIDNPDQALKAVDGKFGTDVNALLEKHGAHIVGWALYGFGGDFADTKHMVKTPDDLKGLRLRANDAISGDMYDHFGAQGIEMDSADVYTGLQRGQIDGATSGIDSIVSRKWDEVAKNITSVKNSIAIYPVMANLKWWNGLTDAQRTTITDAVKATEKDEFAAITPDYAKYQAAAKADGATVYKVENAEADQWKSDLAFMTTDWLKTAGANGQKLIDDYNNAG